MERDLVQFKHEPLNQSLSSIRLVTVLPRTYRGLIQCRMIHSTIEDDYTCLSYVWGAANDNGGPFVILINGRMFKVYHNLKTFLEVAMIKYPGKPLWIDAICIAQGKDGAVAHP